MFKEFRESWLTLKTVFTGMGITMGHLFGKSVTLQYPNERETLPERARSKLYVDIDDCIGCNLCAKACPVNCIDIETVKAAPGTDLGKTTTGNAKRLWVTRFNIDMAKCMYCDLCVYPCPTECIKMVQEYEYSEYDREKLLLKFSKMKTDQVAEVMAEAEAAANKKTEQSRKTQPANEQNSQKESDS